MLSEQEIETITVMWGYYDSLSDPTVGEAYNAHEDYCRHVPRLLAHIKELQGERQYIETTKERGAG